MALLEVENLHTYYGHVHALKGISLTVDEGEIVTLIGANGAGKTTTLMTISRQIPHVAELGGKVTGGSIMYQDEDLLEYKPHQVVGKFGISQVPEGRRIFGNLSVLENLRLATYARKDRAQVEKDFKRVFEIFPRLEERRHQRGETLSGGEQQMLAVGRALMTRGRLMLLDEPTSHLDIRNQLVIYRMMRRLAHEWEMAVVCISHDVNLAARFADALVLMRAGRVLAAGPPAEVCRQDVLAETYDVGIELIRLGDDPVPFVRAT